VEVSSNERTGELEISVATTGKDVSSTKSGDGKGVKGAGVVGVYMVVGAGVSIVSVVTEPWS
jgi:hypothetical protein